jgi:hypothetical protein
VHDDDPDFDIDAYVIGMHDLVMDLLGDEPELRLAVAEIEAGHIINGMLLEYGVDGVRIASNRLRHSIDIAERNALMSNQPMRQTEVVS